MKDFYKLSGLTLALLLVLSGCNYQPLTSQGRVTTDGTQAILAESKQQSAVKSISGYDPASVTATAIVAPSGKLASTSVVLQPGSLAVATDLVMEEAAPLSETAVTSSLKIAESVKVTPVGAGVIVRPATSGDLLRPMTISISTEALGLRGSSALGLKDSSKNYAVFYKSTKEGQLHDGVIPGNQLTYEDNNKVSFDGYFGAYWLAEVSESITKRVEVATAEPTVNSSRIPVIDSSGVVAEETVKKADAVTLVLNAVTPVNVKANSLIRLAGEGFDDTVSMSIDGQNVALYKEDWKTAHFFLPPESALGIKKGVLRRGEQELPFVIRMVKAEELSPLTVSKAAEVCLGEERMLADGTLLKGVKACVDVVAECAAEGQVGCLTTPTLVAAGIVGLANKVVVGQKVAGIDGGVVLPTAGKVLSGVVFGAPGAPVNGGLILPPRASVKVSAGAYGELGATVVGSLADCSAGGQTGCVTSSSYKSMNLTLANAAMVDLSASNFNASLSSANSFEYWDSSGTRHQGSGDAALVAGNIKSGVSVLGVAGSFAGASASPSCTSEGQTGCSVDGSTYGAALLSGLAGKVVSGQSVAGVGGNVVLPAAGRVLTGTSFGANSATAGLLTLPAAGFVRVSAGTFGDPTAATTPALADCGADGDAGCFVVGPNFKAAAVATGTADKILSGQTLAGVTGNLTLPAVGKVLTGINFGVAGSGLTGTLTLPLASNVKSGTGGYGDPGAQITPSFSPDFPAATNVRVGFTTDGVPGALADCTTGNQSGCVTTANIKSMDVSGATAMPDLNTSNIESLLTSSAAFEFWDSMGVRHTSAGDADLVAANVKSGVNILGVNGGLTGAPTNCSTDGQSNCLVDGGTTAAAVLSGLANKVLIGTSVAGVTGNVALPPPGKVLTGITFGASNLNTGTLTLPGSGYVKVSNGSYGDPSSPVTPTFAPDYPDPANVRVGDTTDYTAGTLVDCSAANQTGCVSTATFRTMDLSGASATTDLTAGNLNASLASASNFEFWDSTGIRHQASGTANLIATKILSGTEVFGVTGSLAEAPVNCSTNGAQNCVATGTFFAGSECSANGSNCFLPGYATTTKPLKAISYDAINAFKSSIRNNTTIAGITGTLTDCADSDSGCYVVGPSFQAAAISTTGPTATQDKIMFGETVAGIPGTVKLPEPKYVLVSQTYGIGGNGLTGSLTLPGPNDVLSSSGTYGNPTAPSTPTLTLPLANRVLAGTNFGVGGSGSTGTLTLPTSSDVRMGSNAFGIGGTSMTGSFVCPIDSRPQAPTLSAPTFTFGSPDNIALSWNTVSGASGYMIVMRRNADVNFAPADGTSYTAGTYEGSNKIVYVGSALTTTLSLNLIKGSTYHFAAFSYTGPWIWSGRGTTARGIPCGNPSGEWVGVPADEASGTSSFCIMKYEAKNISSVPTSQAANIPWTGVNQAAAKTYCEAIGPGYSLPSNNDWMALASNIAGTAANWTNGAVGDGSLNKGHSDNTPNTACEASADDSLAYVNTCNAPTNNSGIFGVQRRTDTLSTGAIIWDVAGNVSEWILGPDLPALSKPYVSGDTSAVAAYRELSAVNTGFTVLPLTQLRPTNASKNWWIDTWNSAQGIGQYYSGTANGAMIRGGYFNEPTSSGIFSANFALSATSGNAQVGFRCIFRSP